MSIAFRTYSEDVRIELIGDGGRGNVDGSNKFRWIECARPLSQICGGRSMDELVKQPP